MNLKSFLFLGAGVLGLGAFSVAAAAPDSTREAVRNGMRRMAQELGLTDAQKAELRGLREGFRERRGNKAGADGLDRQSRREAVQARRAQLRDQVQAELQSDSPDVDWLYSLLEEQSEKRLARRKAHLDRRMKIYAVLTPEQRTVFAESLEDRGRRGKRGDRRGRHGHRGSEAE